VRAKHTHGNHTVEMIWTIAPALILVFLALYQMELWARMKANAAPADQNPVKFQIFAKQFEWNFRYPGADGEFGTKDDIYTVKQLVLPAGRPANAELRAMDVLHSFFLPNFRFKNDAVPGVPMFITIPAARLSRDRKPIVKMDGSTAQLDYWDIACAELCGNLHTTMSGRLFVVTPEEYERWLAGDTTVCPATQVAQYPDEDDNIWNRWAWQDNPRTVPGPPKWHRNPFGRDDKGDDDEEEEEGGN
jgi:cytochrome c oxidase subunit 2